MADAPPIAEPPQAVKDHLKHFYWPKHQDLYERHIWPKLDEVRDRWEKLENGDRIALLKLSYINSVFSVRESVDQYESGFANLMRGQSLPDSMEDSGMGLALYYRPDWDKPLGRLAGKIQNIYETVANDTFWDALIALIEDERYNDAQVKLSQAGNIGTAKAPFTLANLGFTQKMCIDANVARIMGTDQPGGNVGVDSYEQMCSTVRLMFPELADKMAPYHLQWLLFDYQRIHRYDAAEEKIAGGPGEEPARHEVWFDAALGPMDRIRDVTSMVSRDGHDAIEDDTFKEAATMEMARRFLGNEKFDELIGRRAITAPSGEMLTRDEINARVDEAVDRAMAEDAEADKLRVKQEVDEAMELAAGRTPRFSDN